MNNYNTKLLDATSAERRYIIHQGGTGSGKTYAILQYLAVLAVGSEKGYIISVVSESMPHLQRGAMRDFRRIIHSRGWTGIEENKTEHCFYMGKSIVEFFSARDESRLRGARRDILFINECNNIDYESFQQLDVRTRIRTILDYNPVRRFWVHNDLLPSLQESDYLFMQSTYKDNPFLSPQEIANIERRRHNENWWKVYGEGEIGNAEGLIFTNWTVIQCRDDMHAVSTGSPLPGTVLGYGIDFGFTHSPTAIVQVNEYEGELYVRELLYKTGMHNDEIYAFASRNLGLKELAVADSAEPKTVDYLFHKGWPGLYPAIKGPDSVEHGINLLLDRKINVTADSLNLIKEMREYMWDTDMRGNFIHRPIKENDHAIDAMRYVYSYPKKKKLIMA